MHSSNIPKLTPIVHPWIKDVTSNYTLLEKWMSKWGSPVNLLNLFAFEQNFQKFDRLLGRLGVKGKVYFARKANKCVCFVWGAKEFGFGVDTASLNEMKDCIQAGISPEMITVTAAVKNRSLLSYAVAHQIPVMLDNEDECELLHSILEKENKTLNVGFRVSGFEFGEKKLYSRFGFDMDGLVGFLTTNLLGRGKYSLFRYVGLHFHLNGYCIKQRAAALSQCIDVVDKLDNLGFSTSFIDIGGGILMNYLKYEEEWEGFLKSLKETLLMEKEEITFQKDTLGMVKVGERLVGEPKVYPYYNQLYQERFVEQILTTKKEDKALHQHLSERNLELRLEPGRSLLDQAGITLAKVAFRKRDMEGRHLVGLEMNRTQMFSSSADFLLDPIFIPKTPKPVAPCEVYLVGAYCLEQELILKRKISLPQFPEVGDIICFVNTAGYMMHFYESQAHLFELAENLVVNKNGDWEAIPDEDFKAGKIVSLVNEI
jgi:diaminopimelate decarboxylase